MAVNSNAVFDDILVASQLEEAAIDLLSLWLPTYLREVERQLGLTPGQIPTPEGFSNRNSFDYVPGDKYPKVVVISPGLDDTPTPDGSGVYRAVWRLGVGVALGAPTEVIGNLWVKVYGAAIRKIMIDKPSLGGLAIAIRWMDEQYDDLPIDNPNILFKQAAIYFSVDCNNVSTRWKGPEFPDDEPYVYGRVERVIIDLEKVAIDA